jgi:diacylglycerol kinase family enzyme
MARQAVSGAAEVVGMAGGNGSQSAVAAVAAERDIPFVCVLAGTRNHFAADIGLDRHDVEIATLVAAEQAGALQELSPASVWTTPRLRVDSGGPVEITLDAEAALMEPPLLFESRPRPLRIRVPLRRRYRGPIGPART